MSRLSSFRSVASSALCCALVACAGSVDPAAPIVSRTPAPRHYQKTITDYLAFRIRGAQKNLEIRIDEPEPGACPLDGYVASMRGWVVPVFSATRSGDVNGKQTINIATKQYYFWFLGDTIAGISRRIEQCPGVATVFGESAQPVVFVAAPPAPTMVPAPTSADVGAQKPRTGHAVRKASSSPGKVHRATKKVGHPRRKTKPKLEW